jgi:hypothetical protein
MPFSSKQAEGALHAPMLRNYLLHAGRTWYLQLFFYTVSEKQMGRHKFSSWTPYVASIIIFSSLRGEPGPKTGSGSLPSGRVNADCRLWELSGLAAK